MYDKGKSCITSSSQAQFNASPAVYLFSQTLTADVHQLSLFVYIMSKQSMLANNLTPISSHGITNTILYGTSNVHSIFRNMLVWWMCDNRNGQSQPLSNEFLLADFGKSCEEYNINGTVESTQYRNIKLLLQDSENTSKK